MQFWIDNRMFMIPETYMCGCQYFYKQVYDRVEQISLSGVLGLLMDSGTVFHVLFPSCGWGVEKKHV